MERIRISNEHLPGYTSITQVTEPTSNGVMYRAFVYDPQDAFVGAVVYVRVRHRRGGSTYGWRPDGQPRAALTTKVDAVRRLLQSSERPDGPCDEPCPTSLDHCAAHGCERRTP